MPTEARTSGCGRAAPVPRSPSSTACSVLSVHLSVPATPDTPEGFECHVNKAEGMTRDGHVRAPRTSVHRLVMRQRQGGLAFSRDHTH